MTLHNLTHGDCSTQLWALFEKGCWVLAQTLCLVAATERKRASHAAQKKAQQLQCVSAEYMANLQSFFGMCNMCLSSTIRIWQVTSEQAGKGCSRSNEPFRE